MRKSYTVPSALTHLKDYDLVVIGVGLFDVVKRCKSWSNMDAVGKLDATLQVLKQTSSPNLQIAIRTVGHAYKKVIGEIVEGFDSISAMLNHT